MTAATLDGLPTVIFPSQEALTQALSPLSLEEVQRRMSLSSVPIDVSFSQEIKPMKVIPLRNPGVGNLLETPLFKTKIVTVYYPESPRVPHHLTIALNRQVNNLREITAEENLEFFATIKKIHEVYQSKLSITGFVTAQYDTPQEGHQGRYVIEIIPHLPGFNSIKHTADKADCNRYVFFRTANLSTITYMMDSATVKEHIAFWQTALQSAHPPLEKKDIAIQLPHNRHESHHREAKQFALRHLLEILQDRGGLVLNVPFFPVTVSSEIPDEVKDVTVEKCAFCTPETLKKQLVFEDEEVCVLYNMRKSPQPGSYFLILPKRHTEKIYDLTPSEMHHIFLIRKALVEVLKETHPGHEVVVYTQDDPAVGQTVFHSHEQVIAIDTKTIALTWTLQSLYPNDPISNEDMLSVRQHFSAQLTTKLSENPPITEECA